jgi:hypothetical protein
MTFKSRLSGIMIALVAMALSSMGCSGSDECSTAAAHLADCTVAVGSPTSAITGSAAKCDNDTLCIAECINRTECPALADAYGGKKSDGADTFVICTNLCVTP